MNSFKKIWTAIDGKKMITGVLVCVLTGVAKALQKQFPQVGAIITDDMILTAAAAGTAFIIGGGAHKVVKAKAKNGGK